MSVPDTEGGQKNNAFENANVFYLCSVPALCVFARVCVCDAVIHARVFMIEMEQWHQSSSHLPGDRTPEWER